MHYQKYLPTKASRDKYRNNDVIHKEEGSEHRYIAVRCGLSWPTSESPAYYCILAEEYVKDYGNGKRRGKLVLLAEYDHEALNIDSFFQRMTDDLSLFNCSSICTNLDDYPDYAQLFMEYTNDNKVNGDLCHAPYADNFTLGIGLITDWGKSGLIELSPEAVASQQINSIARQHLADAPDRDFYAVNALRYVIGYFQKNRPTKAYRPRRDALQFSSSLHAVNCYQEKRGAPSLTN